MRREVGAQLAKQYPPRPNQVCVRSYCMKMHMCARSQMINVMKLPDPLHVLCPPASQHSSMAIWCTRLPRDRPTTLASTTAARQPPLSKRCPAEAVVWDNEKPGLTSRTRRYMNDCISSILKTSAIHLELISSPSPALTRGR
jgi:hypothetical protein